MVELNPTRIAEIIIGFVVVMLLLSALAPMFIQSSETFGQTIGNYTSLSPLKPLVDNLPLLFFLGIIVGLVILAIKVWKSD